MKKLNKKRYLLLSFIFLKLEFIIQEKIAFAYIGPGAGFSFFGPFLAWLLPLLGGFVIVLIKPFKKAYSLFKRLVPSTFLRIVVIIVILGSFFGGLYLLNQHFNWIGLK